MKYPIKQVGVMLVGAVLGGLASVSTAAQAAEEFGNGGIQFDVNTIVEFEFVQSNGAYQSTFGVINLDTGEKTPLLVEAQPSDTPQDVTRPSDYEDDLEVADTDDFVGTPGKTVPNPLPEFEFKANARYAFYLESFYNGQPAGMFYSTDAQNLDGRQRARFEGGLAALASGGSLLRWDDTGSVLVRFEQQDTDFDDFVVRIGGHEACPYGNGGSGEQPVGRGSDRLGQLMACR